MIGTKRSSAAVSEESPSTMPIILRKRTEKKCCSTTVNEVPSTNARNQQLQVLKCFILDDQYYNSHLTSLSNIVNAGEDKSDKTCFGRFMKMKIVQFCDGFVHHMLLRHVHYDNKIVMEFEFNHVGVMFNSRKTFGMITRLNYGKFPNASELDDFSYDLWVKYFGTLGPISQSDFHKAFKAIEFKEDIDEEVEDNVKASMFYFLETLLILGDQNRLVKSLHVNILSL